MKEHLLPPPIFCQDGARVFYKIDDKIYRGGGDSSKSSEKFLKFITHHVLSVCLSLWSLICPSSIKATFL